MLPPEPVSVTVHGPLTVYSMTGQFEPPVIQPILDQPNTAEAVLAELDTIVSLHRRQRWVFARVADGRWFVNDTVQTREDAIKVGRQAFGRSTGFYIGLGTYPLSKFRFKAQASVFRWLDALEDVSAAEIGYNGYHPLAELPMHSLEELQQAIDLVTAGWLAQYDVFSPVPDSVEHIEEITAEGAS